MWQIAPVLTSIPYNEHGIRALERLKFDVERCMPELGVYGERRARRAYLYMIDTLTKPSYVKRLFGEYPGVEKSQHETLIDRFIAEPRSGGLVYHPKDLCHRH